MAEGASEKLTLFCGNLAYDVIIFEIAGTAGDGQVPRLPPYWRSLHREVHTRVHVNTLRYQ